MGTLSCWKRTHRDYASPIHVEPKRPAEGTRSGRTARSYLAQWKSYPCAMDVLPCSEIRGTLVRIMLPNAPKRPRVTVPKRGKRSPKGKTCKSSASEERVSCDASACMFWCAVALGGLLQGRPLRSVRQRYSTFNLLSVMPPLHESRSRGLGYLLPAGNA